MAVEPPFDLQFMRSDVELGSANLGAQAGHIHRQISNPRLTVLHPPAEHIHATEKVHDKLRSRMMEQVDR